MNPATNAPTPMTHWLISGAGLIWNLFGLSVYVQTVSMTPEDLAAAFSAEQVRYIEAIPVWATSANAIAVTFGVLACILLLLRRSLAMPAFLVSLAALIVQDVHSFVLNNATAVFGMYPIYVQGTVLVVAIALLFYARGATKKGILA